MDRMTRLTLSAFLALTTAVSTGACSGATSAVSPDDGESAAAEQSPEVTSATTPGLGEKVRDGNFEYVVHGRECGIERVGGGVGVEEAGGQFCVIELSVSNVGDTAQNFYNRNAYLYNQARVAEEKYPVDVLATVKYDYALTNDLVISAGHVARGNLVFDVPFGMVVNGIELHESASSAGIQVALE